MRKCGFGVVAVALLFGVGCGKTNIKPNSDTGSNASSGSGGRSSMGGASFEGFGNSPTSGGMAVAGGDPGSGGNAGGPMLPPDGDVPPAVSLDKLDLLLMIDNSRSTLEKQRLLADGLKWLLTDVTRLTSDVHVGVITSSLGSHGASGAKDVCVTPDDNDRAHLLATVRPGVPSFQDSGFLAWGPGADADVATVLAQLEPMLAAVGDKGCGYEASLESWYRFLVQPDPAESIVVPPGQSTAVPQGVDAALLAQRKAFLRDDSVLAIVMLSDENDCSIMDEGYGWLISRAAPMYRATSACETNPNDKCCQSCGEQAANAGCPAISSDVACQRGTNLTGMGEDDLNLRCWEQKRRFGFDMLYPVSRYVDGVTRQFALDRNGEAQRNPLFAGQGKRRHPSQVIVAGILGVPWQDLADTQSLTGSGLRLLSGGELKQSDRWKVIVGDPAASPPVPPTDPFMVETPEERTGGFHPFDSGSMLVASTSMNPAANAINGHEAANLGNRQLQAACIFPLATPRVCDRAAFDADVSCSCFEEDLPYNNAVCQPPGGGQAATTQYRDAAYPSIRQLQLLSSLADNGVTASICPKNVTPNADDYGYRPAMRSLSAVLEKIFEL